MPITASDEEILEWARGDGRAVVTQDLDFSTLLALQGHNGPSLITIRTTDATPSVVTRRLLEILPDIEEQLRQGCVVTVEDTRYRVRSLPIV